MVISAIMPAYQPLWYERVLLAAARIADTLTGRSASRHYEEEFLSVIRQYDRLIAGICLSFSQSREDFDDLRQDALLNIWRGLEKFRNDSSLSTWIYRVTLNTCVSFQRKSRQTNEISLQDLYAELYDNSTAEETEQYSTMYRLIGRLSPLDRSIILMWLDGKKYEEIAEVIGISRNGTASRIKRAKDRLTEMYNDLNEE